MNMIDLIGGIPAHPLIVHLAVILLPLAAGLAVLLAFWGKARNAWTWSFLMFFTLVGTAAAWAARITGEQLAMLVGYPGEHGTLGERATIVASVFALAILGWVIAETGWIRDRKLREAVRTVFSAVSVISGVLVVLVVVLAGHSGATATWQSRTEAALSAPRDGVSDQSVDGLYGDADTEDVEGGVSVALTAEMIAQNFGTEDACWTIIDSTVYDMTPFIEDHRGGRGNILELCGVDGSDVFAGQHGGQSAPEATLAKYRVGELGTTVTLPADALPQSFPELTQ